MSSITELLDELQIKILDMEDKLEDLDRATRRLRQERDEATSELRRSISADELREGMQVAYCVPRGKWETCTVQRSADGTGEGFKDPMWGRRVFGIEDAIVLLEDAPEPEQPTTTVADLEAAPVGSKLSAIPGYRTPCWAKRSDGLWEDISNEYALPSGDFQPTLGARTLTHPERRGEVIDSKDLRNGDLVDAWADHKLIFEGARIRYLTVDSVVFYDDEVSEVSCYKHNKEFRLIHRPSTEPVTAETIRDSEPGSTWDWHHPRLDVSTWEWEGEAVRLHAHEGRLGGTKCTPESLFQLGYRVTRSTAPSRGDYSPRAPKVGDEVTTEEELEALPALSVVLDKDGYAFRKSRGPGEWFMEGDSEPWDFEEMIPPFKVVHVGGEGE